MHRERFESGDCDWLKDHHLVERNRFFHGKFMTARDFEAEQAYFLLRGRMRNRFLLGCGIACGLGVEEHPQRECRRRWVRIRCGLAIDALGREIVLSEDALFKLAFPGDDDYEDRVCRPCPPRKEADAEQCRQEQREKPAPTPPECPESRGYLICIRHRECPIEPVPVLYADSGCATSTEAPNRIREIAELCQIPVETFDKACLDGERRPSYACGADLEEPECNQDGDKHQDCGCSCSKGCPCGEWIPLALVKPPKDPNDPCARLDIDPSVRRYTHAHCRPLTTITQMNWTHAGRKSIDELRFPRECDSENKHCHCYDHLTLWIRFSRPITPAPVLGPLDDWGFDRHALRIERYFRTSEPQPLAPCYVFLMCDRRTVVFVIRDDADKCRVDDIIRVTLNCDTIVDCDGRAVDGNLLCGRPGSGDGVPGGIFQSWFQLCEPQQKAEQQA